MAYNTAVPHTLPQSVTPLTQALSLNPDKGHEHLTTGTEWLVQHEHVFCKDVWFWRKKFAPNFQGHNLNYNRHAQTQ
jgi:hypothetical protein